MLYRLGDFSPSQREYPIVKAAVESYIELGYIITENAFVYMFFDNTPSDIRFSAKVDLLSPNKTINQLSLRIFENYLESNPGHAG